MCFARFISGIFNFRCSARIFYGNLDPKLTRAIKVSARAKNPFEHPSAPPPPPLVGAHKKWSIPHRTSHILIHIILG